MFGTLTMILNFALREATECSGLYRLLEAYDSLERNIMRVDVARVAVLHLYGGVYSDLDISFKSVKPRTRPIVQ